MLSSELHEKAVKLLSALEEATPLIEVLQTLAGIQQSVDAWVLQFAMPTDRTTGVPGNIHSAFASTRQALTGRSVKRVFRAAGQLAGALVSEDQDATRALVDVADMIERFEERLDAFASSHSNDEAAALIKLADKLMARLAALEQDVKAVAAQLAPIPPDDGDEVLRLRIDGEFGLREMSVMLQAFDDICEILREALLERNREVRFRVLKVESGSFEISVIAERLGIAALRRLLRNGIDFWYRNYTREGRLKHGVQDTKVALTEALKLRNAMAKEGMDVEGIDEALVKHAEDLVHRIGALSTLGTGISVDGKPLQRREPTMLPDQPRLPGNTVEPPRIGHQSGEGNEPT